MASKAKSLELKSRIGVDGEQTYKQSLNSIAASLKVMKAEMTATQSAFGDNADSIEALTAKQKALQEQQEKHTEKVELLKEMLELAKAEFGENSAEADEYRIKVANAETALNKCTNELNKTTTALDSMGGSAGDAGDDAEGLGGDLSDLGDSAGEAGEGAGELGDDLDDLGDSADEAGDDTGTFGEKLKNVASIIGSGLAASAEAVAAAFAAVGRAAAEAVSGGFELAQGAGAFADDILTLSTQTGISAERLQEWSYASRFVDTSVETMTGSMRRLTANMGSAASGSEGAQDKFDALGVSIYDMNGNLRDNEDVFMDCIDALGQIENPTERDAAAMDLFGKSAQELNPLIEAGSGALRAMGDEAHEMGVVFSDEALAAMGSFDDSMQRLDATGEALKTTIGEALIPAFQPLVDTASQAMADITTALQDGLQPEDVTVVGETIAGALKDGIASVTSLLEEIGPDLGEALGNLVNLAVEALPDLLDTLLPVATGILGSIADGLTENAEQIGTMAGDIIVKLGDFLAEYAPQLVSAAGDILGGLIDGLLADDNLANLTTSAVEMIGELAAGLVDAAVTLLEKAPEIMAQLIEGLKNVDWAQLGLDLINGLINGLTAAVNALLETIKTIFVGIWDAIKGVFGIHSPSTEAADMGGLILDGLIKGFEDAVDAVCETVKRIFGKIWDAIRSIFGFGGESEESKESKQAGQDIMNGIKEGVTGSEEDVKSAVKDAAKKALDMLKSELGVEKGSSEKTKAMGEAVAKGIQDGLNGATEDDFIDGALTIFDAVSSAINTAFGVSGTGFLGWGEDSATKFEDIGKAVCKAIADGISSNNSNTEAVKDAITSVANTAYEAAVGEMASGITGSTDDVNAAVKAVAEAAVAAAEDVLTDAQGREAGSAYTAGIAGGVTDSEDALLKQIDATASAVTRTMSQTINEMTGRTAGGALGNGLARGIRGTVSAVRAAAFDLAQAATTALWEAFGRNGSNFTAIGSAIASGVARGITDGAGNIASAARRAAESAYDAAARTLGIHSPSTVMREIGLNYDEGFAQGIESGMRSVIDSATQLSSMAAASVQTTRSQAVRIDYDQMGAATANALKSAGIDRPVLAVGRRVLAETIEPDVSRATRARSGQSVAGRSSRMVIT